MINKLTFVFLSVTMSAPQNKKTIKHTIQSSSQLILQTTSGCTWRGMILPSWSTCLLFILMTHLSKRAPPLQGGSNGGCMPIGLEYWYSSSGWFVSITFGNEHNNLNMLRLLSVSRKSNISSLLQPNWLTSTLHTVGNMWLMEKGNCWATFCKHHRRLIVSLGIPVLPIC